MGHGVDLDYFVSVGLDVPSSSEDLKVCSTLHADSSPNLHTSISPMIHLINLKYKPVSFHYIQICLQFTATSREKTGSELIFNTRMSLQLYIKHGDKGFSF